MSNPQTVYLVDDDVSIRKALPRALKLRGYNVLSFNSAEAFLEVFSIDFKGCLLLDLSMPAMSGLELQEALLERGARLPIIFITGYGGVPESVMALKRGAIDFLEKPFTQETLLHRIEEAFARDREITLGINKREELLAIFNRLTDRELEILKLMVSGAANLSNKEVARKLGISFRTIGHHRASIMDKTQARSFTDLARMADAAGILKYADNVE